jgi:acyl-coenzyme A thioesterase PaaI-like protein
MKTLGASLELVEPGHVHIAVPFSPALTQQHNYVHAGVISSIADSACGYAAMTLAPSGAEVLTVEFKISLLAPGARAALPRYRIGPAAGKRLSFCTGEVRAIRESDEELIATMLSTIHHQTV